MRSDGLRLPDETQSGAFFTALWHVGANTDLRLRAESVRRKFGEDEERDVRSLVAGADYRLGPRTLLTLELTRTEESVPEGSSGSGYIADLVSLFVTRSF
jgi:hypothetical protein